MVSVLLLFCRCLLVCGFVGRVPWKSIGLELSKIWAGRRYGTELPFGFEKNGMAVPVVNHGADHRAAIRENLQVISESFLKWLLVFLTVVNPAAASPVVLVPQSKVKQRPGRNGWPICRSRTSRAGSTGRLRAWLLDVPVTPTCRPSEPCLQYRRRPIDVFDSFKS